MASKNFNFDLKAYENQGNLWLKWDTNAPFRAQQGQLHVYKSNSFPTNPQDDTKEWNWDNNKQPWDTGLDWGTGWHCAWIAEKSPNGPYTYVVTVITDKTMGKDVLKSEK